MPVGLYEGAGYPSMFAYCRAVLRLSEDAAYNRIKAARAARTVSGDRGDAGRWLAQPDDRSPSCAASDGGEPRGAPGRGRGQGQAGRRGAAGAMVPAAGRRGVGAEAAESRTATSATACDASWLRTAAISQPLPHRPASAVPSVAPSKPALVRPLAPERYEVRFTADAETRALLKEAQDLLGHAVPTGDLATVFHRALTVLVADLKRRKFGATARPRPPRTSNSASGDVPAAVRREVVARDANRCAFVSKNGRRCEETRFLEFHHVVPRAAGGGATVDNIQLRCRAHNGHEVDLFFGPGKRWAKRSRPVGRALPSPVLERVTRRRLRAGECDGEW